MSFCMCEPRRLPSLTAMTHAVVAQRKWAREHGLHRVWSFVSVGCEPGPLIGARTRTWENERKTPFPCVETNRQNSEATAKTEQQTTRNVAWTGQDRTRLRDNMSAHIISHQSFAGVHSCFQTSVTDMVAGEAEPAGQPGQPGQPGLGSGHFGSSPATLIKAFLLLNMV